MKHLFKYMICLALCFLFTGVKAQNINTLYNLKYSAGKVRFTSTADTSQTIEGGMYHIKSDGTEHLLTVEYLGSSATGDLSSAFLVPTSYADGIIRLRNNNTQITHEFNLTDQSSQVDVALKPLDVDVDVKGGSFTLLLNSNSQWTASASNWITMSTFNGEGKQYLTIHYEGNHTTTARQGTISFLNRDGLTVSFNINQSGDIYLSPSLTVIPVASTGGSKEITITSNVAWEVPPASPYTGISLNPGSGPAGETTVIATVQANDGQPGLKYINIHGASQSINQSITANYVDAPSLFISEYVIDANGKTALELYNGSDSTVSLHNFAIEKEDGSGVKTLTPLSGAVAPGMAFVLCSDGNRLDHYKRSHLVCPGDGLDFSNAAFVRLVYKGANTDAFDCSHLAAGANQLIRNAVVDAPAGDFQANEWNNSLVINYENLGMHKTSSYVKPGFTKTENYVATVVPMVPMNSVNTWDMPTTAAQYAVNYVDGLGRNQQAISLGQSPLHNDVVQPIVYDDFGRQTFNLLPYVYHTNGNYDASAVLEDDLTGLYTNSHHYEFYTTHSDFNNWSTDDRQKTFSETVFDGSPLNRIMKQGAPGADWQVDHTTTDRLATEHVTSNLYETNMAGEIYLFEVDASGKLDKTGTYGAGKLFKNTLTDENGNPGIAYKNIQGQVILKESQVDAATRAKTYYIYDNFGMLRYVLPPEATAKINTGSTAHVNIQAESWVDLLCYYYQYDGKKRMVRKKLPGADSVKFVYDGRNRLVLIQDGAMQAGNQYLFTQYDELNRPTVTGKITITGSETDILNYFDDYTHSQATAFDANGYISDYATGTGITISSKIVLTETYYDDYNYPGVLAFDTSTCIAYANEANGHITETLGMVTGSKTRLGEGNYWITETPYYDTYSRMIWSKRTVDFEGELGTETVSTFYNFAGLALRSQQTQTFNGQTTVVNTVNSYDHAGRLVQTDQQVNSGSWETLSQMKYNELGQLIEKKLGNGIQTVDFEYNIRGWLTQLNDPADAVNENTGNDLFAMELMYNKYQPSVNNPSDKQYNGNITAMQWTAKNSNQVMERQAYGFTYDGLDRLLGAGYAIGQWEPADDGFVNVLTASNNYLVSGISYDLNGNITSLQRNDKDITGYLDNLEYNYTGNQLSYVTDAGDLDNGFKSNATAQASTKQYGYDANGNMRADNNKGITSVTYNHLNLPTQVMLGANYVNYLYGAGGTKYKKTTSDGLGTCYYFSNFEYGNNMQLAFIHTSEGRVRNDGGNFKYDYYLKDHLGNTRVVFTEENGAAKELQVSNYYPFGMRFNQSNTYDIAGKTSQYMYNGKELQEDFDLDWMDYGARFYDGALGRFMSIDPLAEQFGSWTPYHYVHNNPIRLIDPTGMSAENPDWWVNEQSGSITHTPGIGNRPEGTEGDENVKRLGDDGMFGDAGAAIEYKDDKSGNETTLTPEDSKEMAEKSGYKAVPVEVETVEDTKSQNHSTGKFGVDIKYGDGGFSIETKVSYVPKDFEEVDRSVPNYIEDNKYDRNIFTNGTSNKAVYSERIFYGRKNKVSKVANNVYKKVLKPLSGSHDYSNSPVVKHPLTK